MSGSLFHVAGLFSQPDDVGSQLRTFFTCLAELDGRAVDAVSLATRSRTARETKFTMQVQNARRAGAFVQVVDVLRDHRHVEVLLELCDGAMRGVGIGRSGLR